jgi:hypothetical protein
MAFVNTTTTNNNNNTTTTITTTTTTTTTTRIICILAQGLHQLNQQLSPHIPSRTPLPWARRHGRLLP